MNTISIPEYRALLSAKPPKKERRHDEEDLHRACIEWMELVEVMRPILRWAMHTPSGGKRPYGEAGKMKAMGAKKGYPDIVIPFSHHGWKGLAIELKSSKGRVSVEQKAWLDKFESDGYLVAVCRTLDEFITVIDTFTGVKKHGNNKALLTGRLLKNTTPNTAMSTSMSPVANVMDATTSDARQRRL